jgi:hypothetical protein
MSAKDKQRLLHGIKVAANGDGGEAGLDINEGEKAAMAYRNWMIGLGVFLVVTGIIIPIVLELGSPWGPLPVRVTITSDFPSTTPVFQYSVYPIDIVIVTHTLVLGVGMVIFALVGVVGWAKIAYAETANHWLRLLFGLFVTWALSYVYAQSFSITNVMFIVCFMGFAQFDPILKYLQDLLNPVMGRLFGKETLGADDVDGDHQVHFQPHFFGWVHFAFYQSIILAYGISTAIAQAAYEVATPHPGRMWFTIVNFCVQFVGFGLLHMFHGVRYWRKEYAQGLISKMRRLDGYEVAYLIIYVIMLATYDWTMLFVGITIGGKI